MWEKTGTPESDAIAPAQRQVVNSPQIAAPRAEA